jgi:hypothetical protein
MHRRCDFFRFWPLLALILAGAAPTVRATQALSSLYGTVVADSNAQQAAQDAMREVLVRLTGARDAASDPAHALANDRLHATAASAPGALEYRYQAGP